MTKIREHLADLFEFKRQEAKQQWKALAALHRRARTEMGWQQWLLTDASDDLLPAPRLETRVTLSEAGEVSCEIVLVLHLRGSVYRQERTLHAERTGQPVAVAVMQRYCETADEGGLGEARVVEGLAVFKEAARLQLNFPKLPSFAVVQGDLYRNDNGGWVPQPDFEAIVADEPFDGSVDSDASEVELLEALARCDAYLEQSRRLQGQLSRVLESDQSYLPSCSIPHEFYPALEDLLPAPRLEMRMLEEGQGSELWELVLVLERDPLALDLFAMRQRIRWSSSLRRGALPQSLNELPTTGQLTAQQLGNLPGVVSDLCHQVEHLHLPGFVVFDEEHIYQVAIPHPFKLELTAIAQTGAERDSE